MNERTIFDAAVEIADPQARRAFLEKVCAGKPEMLAAVATLLKSHDAAGAFLNVPVAEQMRTDPASGSDSADSRQPSEVFDKTRVFQAAIPSDDDSDDESQPDLSFLQPSSKPGSIGLLGHYEVLQVLGQGGFGIVLKAFDEKLHRLVAVKVMNAQMAATSPPRKRFLREARAAAAIRHENVVQVHSVEELPLPYLVMEYIDGQTLQQKQKDHGPLEVAELLHIGRQIASGLAAAQAMGLIHRDIKPGNILVEEVEGRRLRERPFLRLTINPQPLVKITDFGLARAADDASLTRSGMISGTPMYMAPEQVLGQTLDHRADLFSLGSVLYELATGRPPFRAANTIAVLRRVAEDTPRPMQEIIPEIPDWLVAIVTKLHAKQPEDRFQSAKEVADLLARCQTELQTKGEVTCVPVAESLRDATTESPSRRSREASVRTLTSPATSEGRHVPKRSNVARWLIAGVIGIAVLAAAIVARRGNDTKSEISNLKSQISNPPAQAESTDSTNPDRRAAEYVLSIGGFIKIKENGQEREIKAVGDLPLGEFELTFINLNSNPKVSDAGLAHLKDCTNLTRLDLNHLPVSDVGLAHFKNCKNLTHLDLSGTQVSDAGLAHFKDYKDLTELDLHGTRVSDTGLAHFKDCKHLTSLNLAGTQVSDAGLAHLKDCKNLRGLVLNGLQVSDVGLAHLKDCQNLTNLELAITQVSDAGLAHFKNLTSLELGATRVSDAGLPDLASLPSLAKLSLVSTRVSLRGHEQLKTALPKCQITWSEPNRSVAEMVLVLGGTVTIGNPGPPESRPIPTATDLPTDFFQVRRVSLVGVTQPLAELLQQMSWLRFPEFDHLESLDLSGTGGAQFFSLLAPIHSLQELNLTKTGVNLFLLPKLPSLKRLVLDDNGIDGPGLASLEKQSALTELSLVNTGVNDQLLAHLPKLPALQRLVLDGNDIRGGGLTYLRDRPELIDLSLGCPLLTDLTAKNLTELKQLKRLSLAGSGLTNAGIKHLASLTNLESLDLRRTKVTAAGIDELKAALPKCQIEWDGRQDK